MSIEQRVDVATEFLVHLHGDTKVKLAQAELYHRHNDDLRKFKEGGQRFVVMPGSMRLQSWLSGRMEKADDGVEIFYAPTPMDGTAGRKKYQVLPSRVAFSDADYGLSDEAHALMVKLGACLVRSGGKTDEGRPKYHVYLRMSREVPLDVLEKINRGLKVFTRGDKFDATSLLRIPGTRNHKYQGSPLVTVERYADQIHEPELLMEMFPVPKDVVSGVELEGMQMPKVPEGFRFTKQAPGYFKIRKVVREWNGRFEDPGQNIHRYGAAIAIVKEAVKQGLSVDVAYAFAMECTPLLDKAAEEDGYNIQKDIAKTYYRETKAPSSGLTVDEIQKEAGPQAPEEPAVESIVPRALLRGGDGPSPYSSRDNRGYLDMAIFTSGEFKPLEPAYFSIDGEFCILYPGMTHCIFGDSGSGKTWIVLAQIAAELKAGKRVKYIDFENGAMTIGNRLRNILGVPPELLTPATFKYMWFSDKPDDAEVDEEAEDPYDLVIIDGVDASLAMWGIDPNKSTEIRHWYNHFPQRFADQGSTVLSIDHTTKKSSKDTPPKDQQPNGAGTKLAVLTGAAFYIHPKDGYELIPGRRGIVEAYTTRKDKDGYLKSKAQRNGHLFNFIIDTAEDGSTAIEFEVAKPGDAIQTSTVTLPESHRKILGVLAKVSTPKNVTAIRELLGTRSQTVSKDLVALAELGYITQEQDGGSRSKLNTITSMGRDVLAGKVSAVTLSTPTGGKPKKQPAKRECRKCREAKPYTNENFLYPDDIGYQVGRLLCRPCGSENIESESEMPRDGAEWAREIREKRDRRKSTHGENDLS